MSKRPSEDEGSGPKQRKLTSYFETSQVLQARDQNVPAPTGGVDRKEVEEEVPPAQQQHSCRFCEKKFGSGTGRYTHEKLSHSNEQGHVSVKEDYVDRRVKTSQKFQQWGPSIPENLNVNHSAIGVHVVDPKLKQTVMAFHVEMGIEQLSETEMRKIKNKGCDLRQSLFGNGQSVGHIIPARSCRESEAAFRASYELINFASQDKILNETEWRLMEDHKIRLAKSFEVSTFTGVVPSAKDSAGKGKKLIPGFWWSLSVLERKNKPPLYDAFITENVKPNCSFWKMRCSVQKIREVTGLNFFAGLKDEPKMLAEVGRAEDYRQLCKSKPIACSAPGCDERFESVSGLNKHKLKHLNPKQFESTRVANLAKLALHRNKQRDKK